jgi:hypothetical protein
MKTIAEIEKRITYHNEMAAHYKANAEKVMLDLASKMADYAKDPGGYKGQITHRADAFRVYNEQIEYCVREEEQSSALKWVLAESKTEPTEE